MEKRTDPFVDLLIGESHAMRGIYRLMEQCSRVPITVLLQGETGTGKELVARGIHQHSLPGKPFIPVNCAALPEPLLESCLFGHKKGAFTGAERDHQGYFEAADGGTILLDEIGEMPFTLQAKVLRVLQDGEVMPIGENKPRHVNVRIIAATNRNLHADIGKTFRQDLYYRLAVFTINIPPLRERYGDIPILVLHYLKAVAEKWNVPQPTMTAEAFRVIERYAWPGNIRELRNEIEGAAARSTNHQINTFDLTNHIARIAPRAIEPYAIAEAVCNGIVSMDAACDTVRAAIIQRGLELMNGNFTKTAELLGTTRRILCYTMEKIPAIEGERPEPQSGFATSIRNIELDMIDAALSRSAGNRAEAARMLGMKRTTLVAKLRRHGRSEEGLPNLRQFWRKNYPDQAAAYDRIAFAKDDQEQQEAAA